MGAQHSSPHPHIDIPELPRLHRHIHVEAKTRPRDDPQFVTCDRACNHKPKTHKGKHMHKHKHKHKHRHHHHHHCHEEVVRIRKEKWDALKRCIRELEESSQSLTAENASLKSALAATRAELQRVSQHVVVALQNQVTALQAENEALRRSLAGVGDTSQGWYAEAERLRLQLVQLEKDHAARILILEKENNDLKDVEKDLRCRLKQLSKQLDANITRRVTDLLKEVDKCKEELERWKRKHEVLLPRYDELAASIERKERKIAHYEDMLRRRGLL